MATRFFVRPSSFTGMSSIYVRVRSRKTNLDVKMSTGYFISSSETSRFFKEVSELSGLSATEEPGGQLRNLRYLKSHLDYQLLHEGKLTKEKIRETVNYYRFSRDYPSTSLSMTSTMTLGEYIRQYLMDVRSGGRTTFQGRNFSRATVASIKVAMEKFLRFQDACGKSFDFQDIDMQFYRDYTAWLKRRNYCINYIGKMIGSLKTVIASAEADGLPVNPAYKNLAFKVTRTDVDSIYLTREELDRINAVDLTGMPHHFAEARDIFMIGVWTAQRVSDYNHIQKKNISTETVHVVLKDGRALDKVVRTIRLIQQKTKKKVVIPCSTELCHILDRYPGELPTLPKQVINNDMKEIGRMAGITDSVEVQITRGGNISKEYFSKYELIHTHTARRTGATLMYLSGMNEYDICRITGHSSLKMLEKYIKAGELETVRKLTEEYDYFK